MLETKNFYDDGFDFLYEYQRKVVEDNNSTVIVNWSRGMGKTFTAMCKVLKDRPKNVLYVSPTKDFFIYFCSKINEIKQLSNNFNETKIKVETTNNEYDIPSSEYDIPLNIQHANGSASKIYWYSEKEIRSLKSHFDLIIFDESLPYNIPKISANQIISFNSFNDGYKMLAKRMFPQNVSVHETTEEDIKRYNKILDSNGLKILEASNFINYYNEFEIYSIPEIGDVNDYTFLKESLKKLQEEFSKIPNVHNTVMTREKLLDMIFKIKNELNKYN